MKQWKMKSCPRCNGDLFIEKDIYGWYVQCIQCGFLKDLDPIYEAKIKDKVKPSKWDRDVVKQKNSRKKMEKRVDKRLISSSQ